MTVDIKTELTDKEVFRQLWSWLALNPDKGKRDWPGFEDEALRLKYAEHNYCPACRTMKMLDVAHPGNRGCHYCPINKSAAAAAKSIDVYHEHYCLCGLYGAWLMGTKLRSETAALIRDLEWEDES
jgi:hypothetical protein